MVMSVVAGVLMGLAVVEAEPSDWTQWRGPSRDGVAGLTAASEPWPAALHRRWRAPAGEGQSSPVVAGDRVFLFSREGGMEVARALDLGTGRTIWSQGYPAPYAVYPGAASFGSGPKSTPVYHEGRLFTLGIGGILTAFDAGGGRRLWQKDFAGRFPAQAPPFGTSMSPLVAEGLLIVHVGGHEGGALLALDPATGTEKWARAGEGPSYSSPILASFEGQPHLVIQVHRSVLGVDPATGRTLWSLPFVTPCDQNIVTPLRVGEWLVLSSLDTGTRAIRLVRKAGAWSPEVVWHTREVSMYMSSPVLVNGRVVGLSHRKRGQYVALDPATGVVHWMSEPGQGENAALVVADGALLILQGEGTLLVLPPDGGAFAPRRRYTLAEGGTYAQPVPTPLGILIKDADGLSLHGREPRSAKAEGFR